MLSSFRVKNEGFVVKEENRVGIVLSRKSKADIVHLKKLRKLGFSSKQYPLIHSENCNDLIKSNSIIKVLIGYLYFLIFSIRKIRRGNFQALLNLDHKYVDIPITIGLGILFRIPIITRVPGNLTEQYRIYKNPIKRFLMGFWTYLEIILIRAFSSKIITVGPFEKKKLFERGISKKRITIIPTLPPLHIKNTGKSDKLSLREKHNLPLNKRIILFVGRVSREKGAHILKKIAKEALEKQKGFLLIVIGVGNMKEKLSKHENVRIVGGKKHEEIFDFYKASDILVLPSLAEGLPNVILEALSVGLPVAATEIGEIPWILSKSFKSCDSLIEYVLGGNWQTEELPSTFHREKLKKSWCAIFASLQK